MHIKWYINCSLTNIKTFQRNYYKQIRRNDWFENRWIGLRYPGNEFKRYIEKDVIYKSIELQINNLSEYNTYLKIDQEEEV